MSNQSQQVVRLPRPGVVWVLALWVLLMAVLFIFAAHSAAGGHFTTTETTIYHSTIATGVAILLLLLGFPSGRGWIRVPLALAFILDMVWPIIWADYDAKKYPQYAKQDVSSYMVMNSILGVISVGAIVCMYAIPSVREWLAAERRWRKVAKPSMFARP